MLELFCIRPYSSWACSLTNFIFGLGFLSNKPKTKAQSWLIYKQTNMNKLFIEPSQSCSWSTWFIYSPNRREKKKMKKTNGGAKTRRRRRRKKKKRTWKEKKWCITWTKKQENIIKLIEAESNVNGYIRFSCSMLQKEGTKM